MQSIFETYDLLPLDPIFSLSAQTEADTRPNKVDLTMGIYRDPNLQSTIFQSIQQAEEALLKQESNKDYLPIGGLDALVAETLRLVMHESVDGWCGVQTLGGTGALRIGADLLHKQTQTVYLPKPTWVNHGKIFQYAGFEIKEYPYYSKESHQLDFDALMASLERASAQNVLVLHGCCHNPSGMDPTPDQWKAIAELCRDKQLIPFFDLAYLGFGSGLVEDGAAIRLFAEAGLPVLVAFSYSKNLGLYGERVGALLALSGEHSENVRSHMQALARASYSNPPRRGGMLATHVLTDSQLRKQWMDELESMRVRMVVLREDLAEKLNHALPSLDFEYLKQCKGMFSYLDLDADAVKHLRDSHGIYLTGSGRLNISGLNDSNMDLVVNAVVEQMR